MHPTSIWSFKLLATCSLALSLLSIHTAIATLMRSKSNFSCTTLAQAIINGSNAINELLLTTIRYYCNPSRTVGNGALDRRGGDIGVDYQKRMLNVPRQTLRVLTCLLTVDRLSGSCMNRSGDLVTWFTCAFGCRGSWGMLGSYCRIEQHDHKTQPPPWLYDQKTMYMYVDRSAPIGCPYD